jgi:hypothetical protein
MSVPERALLTGPVKGSMFLQDGTEVQVGPDSVSTDISGKQLTQPQIDELAHLIGEYWANPNTPVHPEFAGADDPEFVYVAPEQFRDYEIHSANQMSGSAATFTEG